MKLLALHLSGKASETQTFQEKLHMLSQICGKQSHKIDTNQFLRQWFVYVASRNTNPCTLGVNTVLSFMHDVYINGCLHSDLCAPHGALPSMVTIKGYTKL